MDFSLQSHQSFIGRPAKDLPTPSLVLSKPVLERNTQQLLQDVWDLGIHFRAHVKTLKVNKSLHYLQTEIDSSSPRKSRA
jgi:D-serine deaminase-like pyridoxal phosphate-dependent protein